MAGDGDGAGRYVPTSGTRFYPGANMSEERKRQLRDFEVDAAEATYEDILVNTAAAYTGTFYAVMGLIEERWGPEAAAEVARSLGYRNGKANMEKWLKVNGVTEGSAELMARYQDLAHALRGPDHATATTEYDENRCVAHRTRCGWHTARPEGATSRCRDFSVTAIRGYAEKDTAIREIRIARCLSWGDDHCRHEFYYGEPPEEGREDAREVWRRGDPTDQGY
jgi:hypothetical protein